MEHCEGVKNGLSPLRYENTCVACSTKINVMLFELFFLICDNFTIIIVRVYYWNEMIHFK